MLFHRINETLFSLYQIGAGIIVETSITTREIIVFSIIAAYTLFVYYVFETK